MAPRVQTSITLFGSPPWGFRLSGGKEFNQPLVITRVTPGSISAKSGLSAGDVLIAVNGQFVNDMTQDECEAKVKQAAGSLYLVLEKNSAAVTTNTSGEVSVQGDRRIYKDENSDLERLSKYNRSAKPFPTSPQATNSFPRASPSTSGDLKTPEKPAGFRSVSFRPKETTKPSPSPNNGTVMSRREPEGGSTSDHPPSFDSKPRQFSPALANSNDFPPPPADFVQQPTSVPSYRSFSSVPSGTTRVVLGPNQAAGLYSKANAQISYQAQVGGK